MSILPWFQTFSPKLNPLIGFDFDDLMMLWIEREKIQQCSDELQEEKKEMNS